MVQTYFFYDYESWGTEPARDWPAQFAGIRTNADFEEIEQPLELFCRLPEYQLPHPEACLVTGLTPDEVNAKGIPEAGFIGQINEQFSRPNTCVLGYNSIRFDDEMTRYSLYRNFFDPYAREWQNGCSRWDLIDVVRLCAALRPEGINWPMREDGTHSFQLEELTKANGIVQEHAHNAVDDVRATIALARLLREKKPRLFQYALDNRSKHKAAGFLDLISPRPKPVLHISGKFAAARNCLAVVVPLAAHPTNKNEVIVYDLSENPESLLTLEAEEIRERIYTTTVELEKRGCSRIPLKTIRLNRSPILAPVTLVEDPAEQERLGISLDQCRKHYRVIFSGDHKQLAALRQKLMAVYSQNNMSVDDDPDHQLYDGFFSREDQHQREVVRKTRPEQLAELSLPFQDKRLEEMLFRYRARNWPELLSHEDQEAWRAFCRNRIQNGCGGRSLPLADYRIHLRGLMDSEINHDRKNVLISLEHSMNRCLQALNLLDE